MHTVAIHLRGKDGSTRNVDAQLARVPVQGDTIQAAAGVYRVIGVTFHLDEGSVLVTADQV